MYFSITHNLCLVKVARLNTSSLAHFRGRSKTQISFMPRSLHKGNNSSQKPSVTKPSASTEEDGGDNLEKNNPNEMSNADFRKYLKS